MMKLGLAFSGGKDSWACLWLNEARLSDISVIWINTGKNYPELLDTIEKAKKMCKNFIEIKTDREKQNKDEGIPSDIVPIDFTTTGQGIVGKKPIKIQSYLGCCYNNISRHIHGAAKHYGITHLIRGKRNDEEYLTSFSNRHVYDGITHLHPIEGWTKEDVMSYLAGKMEIPEHLHLNHSSMDCYDCTAYRKTSKDRIEFTKKNHPSLYAEYKERMDLVNNAINEELRHGS